MSSAHVSLAPTSASGLLCNSSPLANAIAVATTEADVHALANVVGRQYSHVPTTSWAAEMYGPPQPPAVAVAALHQHHFSASTSTAALTAAGDAAATTAADTTCLFPSSSSPLSPSKAQEGQQEHPQQQQQQQQPHTPPSRVSVARAASVAASEKASAESSTTLSADAGAGQPFAPTGAAVGTSRLRKNVSWQCGLCGYHVLAMDQDGTPLPFATSAFGNTLPLLCPRCKLSHTSWQPSTPFNEQGDHLNLPTTYSNRYIAPSRSAASAQRAQASNHAAGATGDGAATESRSGTLLHQRAAAASLSLAAQQRATQLRHGKGAVSSSVSSLQRRAYYCGHCNRRLLRVDANGELVDMDREADGSIRPICCPGCGKLHSDWVVKPYAVRR